MADLHLNYGFQIPARVWFWALEIEKYSKRKLYWNPLIAIMVLADSDRDQNEVLACEFSIPLRTKIWNLSGIIWKEVEYWTAFNLRMWTLATIEIPENRGNVTMSAPNWMFTCTGKWITGANYTYMESKKVVILEENRSRDTWTRRAVDTWRKQEQLVDV